MATFPPPEPALPIDELEAPALAVERVLPDMGRVAGDEAAGGGGKTCGTGELGCDGNLTLRGSAGVLLISLHSMMCSWTSSKPPTWALYSTTVIAPKLMFVKYFLGSKSCGTGGHLTRGRDRPEVQRRRADQERT